MCQYGVLVTQAHLHFAKAREDASNINLRFFSFCLNIRNAAVSQHMHLSNQMC